MTKDEALKALSSASPHERLKGARFLSRTSQPNDLGLLRRQRTGETDSYVRSALDRAIANATNQGAAKSSPTPMDDAEVPIEVRRELHSQAVRWIAGLLLHEIAGPIGLVDRAASREIEDYERSRTHQRIQIVQRVFGAIEHLQTAATPAKPETFDLAALIQEVVFDETSKHGLEVSQHGPKPLMVTTDPRLLRLAFCNGVRNALDAVRGIDMANGEHPVVVTWGKTDVDVWISVVDAGPGLRGPPEHAFEIGRTTKGDHSGFGLAIARQAMESLGGSVRLAKAAGGGAWFELRWES